MKDPVMTSGRGARVPRWRLPAAALVGVLLPIALLAAAAPRTYLLKENVQRGDEAMVDSAMRMQLRLSLTGEGVPPVAPVTVLEEAERYKEFVAEAAGGRPSVLRRVYLSSRKRERGMEGSTDRATSLHGKTVVIRRTGGGVQVTTAAGKLAAEDRQALLDELDEHANSPLPPYPVSPGDDWDMPEDQARRIFGAARGVETATVYVKFVEVRRYAGRPCARLRLDVDLQGRPPDIPGSEMSIRLSGAAYYALDLRRTIGLDLSGPISLIGVSELEGRRVGLAGEGEMRLRVTRAFSRLAGKPVPPAGRGSTTKGK